MAQRHEVAESLRGAWGSWIAGQPWDLFVTLTSEKQTHPEAMLKRFRYCAHKASDHVYGRRWQQRGEGLQFVVGIERTKQGWPHSHAVVRFPNVDLRGPAGKAAFDLGYWQKWFTGTGGFAWLEIPRSEQAVVAYVTKYVVKDGELELSPTVEFALAQGQQQLHLEETRRARTGGLAGRRPGPPEPSRSVAGKSDSTR